MFHAYILNNYDYYLIKSRANFLNSKKNVIFFLLKLFIKLPNYLLVFFFSIFDFDCVIRERIAIKIHFNDCFQEFTTFEFTSSSMM
jgi:hypothetical protein